MGFPVLLYVQLTLSQESGYVLLERLSLFINSVSNFLNDIPHSISKNTSSNQNIQSSHPLQLFSKAKKSHSPIDMESGFVNMIHLLFGVRKLVRMRIDKMRFHLFHRVLYLSEP